MFDPLEDSHTLNTFTRRDHLFARLEFLLEKGGVTLFHQNRIGDTLQENGVIQLEFSGTQKQFLDQENIFQDLLCLKSIVHNNSSVTIMQAVGCFLVQR